MYLKLINQASMWLQIEEVAKTKSVKRFARFKYLQAIAKIEKYQIEIHEEALCI